MVNRRSAFERLPMSYALSRYDPVRVVVATLGLALAGGASGGIAGALSLATVMLLTGGLISAYGLAALEFAGCVGAVLGVISAPLVVWVMLRRVPLGRAFTWLTAMTMLGGVMGWFAFSSLDIIFGPTLAAFVAFMATAVALSFRYQHAPRLAA